MMNIPKTHLVVVVAFLILRTEAQVNLTTKNDFQEASFICGSPQTLLCTISVYSNSMAWMIQGDLNPIASCAFESCTVNPSYSTDYNFEFNTSTAIFEMTILKVTLAENGTTYSCNDGFISDDVTTDVSVADNCSVTDINKQQLGSNTTELSIKTGCMKTSTAGDVTIAWWFREEDNEDGTKYYQSGSQDDFVDSICKADPDCGTDGYTQKTSTFNVTEDETGTKYIAGVDIKCGSLTNTFRKTGRSFTKNLQVSTSSTVCGCHCYKGIVAAYLAIWFVILQMCICGHSQYSSYLNESMKWFPGLQVSSHVPLFGLIPAIYILYSLPKRDKLYYIWLYVFASVPILGLILKVILAMKSDRLNCPKRLIFVAVSIASFALEIFIILLCTVMCICQWYYPFIIVLCNLILRWILFISIALLYHADIGEDICKDDDVTWPLVVGIALLCFPIIGILFSLYWIYRRRTSLFQKTGSRVTPDDAKLDPVSLRGTAPMVENNTKIKPLSKMPRVRSRHRLEEKDVVFVADKPLPPIPKNNEIKRIYN